jgi:amino acid transporter
LVGLSIQAYARDSAGTGSLFGYVTRSLGPNSGVLGGWALVIAYVGIASACIPLFAYFVNTLLEPLHFQIPSLLLVAVFTLAVWYFAWKDIRLSAHTMLVIEILSLTSGFLLAVVVLVKQGGNIDLRQFQLTNLSWSGIALGLVLAFTAFTGFESAAAVGAEAKNPLKSIPRAILNSSIVSAIYFVVWSYALLAGFRGLGDVTKSAAPVTELAAHFGVPYLALFLTIACTVGTFAVVLASINAGARIVHQLGEHGVVHNSLTGIHHKNQTPHTAITVATIAAFVPQIVLLAIGQTPFEIWAILGTLCTFGFLVAYLLVVIGAPVHLKKKDELKWHHLLVAVLGVGVVLIPFIGSIYPVPAFPFNLLFYIFVALLAVGFGVFQWQRKADPGLADRITQRLNDHYETFEPDRISGSTFEPALES